MERRLSAILAADVVGYSRLMEADEVGTFDRLRTHRKEVFEPEIASRHGRIFKLMGDGLLAEFASVVDAVECAAVLQLEMAKRNSALPDDRRIDVRIGIHVGDVIVEDGDRHGDAVNVAARLEQLAEPGTICVSHTVLDHVKQKVAFDFELRGEEHLKNISEPVRVYRVVDTPRVSVRAPKVPTEKPSIAVLPFTNMSGDPEQEYFSDGITEDIITELSRFRLLCVIARNSSFVFKDKSMRVQDIARELGVTYIVEGSVRRAGDRVRITAQLVEAGSGNHLWAERYDRNVHDIFAVQDEVARAVASTVSGRVEMVGRDRATSVSASALRAYDFLLRAKASILNYSRADNAQALGYAERAMQLDPTSARAHSYMAWCHFHNYMAWWSADREDSLAKAFEFAKRGVVLDEADSGPHCILGLIHFFRREYGEARSEIERAMELNPNDPDAQGLYGQFLAAIGEPDAAVGQIDLAKRLNPCDMRWIPWSRGIAYFTAHRYDEAIAALRQVRDPINEVRGWLAASYAHAGRLQEAKATLEEFLRIAETDMAVFPGRRLKDWEPYWHGAFEYQDQKDFDHLFDGLRKAGLPD